MLTYDVILENELSNLEEGRAAAMLGAATIAFTGLAGCAAAWVDKVSQPLPSASSNILARQEQPQTQPHIPASLIREVERARQIDALPADFRESWAYLTATLWGEARGEGETGMVSVGNVIVNRIRDGRWGDTLREVVLADRQFSCWNSGDKNRRKIERLLETDRRLAQLLGTDPQAYLEEKERLEDDPAWKSWQKAKSVAYDVLSRRVSDNTGGANHYHTTAVSPSWNREMVQTGAVGNHVFFTDRTRSA